MKKKKKEKARYRNSNYSVLPFVLKNHVGVPMGAQEQRTPSFFWGESAAGERGDGGAEGPDAPRGLIGCHPAL